MGELLPALGGAGAWDPRTLKIQESLLNLTIGPTGTQNWKIVDFYGGTLQNFFSLSLRKIRMVRAMTQQQKMSSSVE